MVAISGKDGSEIFSISRAVLSDHTYAAVRALVIEQAARGVTRAQFRVTLQRMLEARRLSDEQYREAFDEGQVLATIRPGIRPDTPEEERIEQAGAILRRLGDQLRAAAWLGNVLYTWPAAIAHELARLVDTLDVTPSRTPSPDAVLLQLRDLVEVTVKLSAIILARAVIARGGTRAHETQQQLYRSLSLGTWVQLLRSFSGPPAHERSPTGGLATAWNHALPALDGFVEARNEAIGHGARAVDPAEFAGLVETLLVGGSYQLASGRRYIPGVMAMFARLVGDNAFAGLSLVAVEPGGHERRLVGVNDAEAWLRAGEAGGPHEGPVLPVVLRVAGAEPLDLAPLISARRCLRCDRLDVMLFDSVPDARRGRFDLLDYARGHKSRVGGDAAAALVAEFGGVSPRRDDGEVELGDSTDDQRVLDALDQARIDRNYRSPRYLRDPLAAFLQSHDRGVFWLTAPAHVGKTTFVQGLASEEIREEPIAPAFEPGAGGRTIVYHCRKEHRTGVAGMINMLDEALHRVYTPSQNVAHEAPDFRVVIDAATPAAFVAYLAAWRDFAARYRLAPADAPILCIIDGLDEADPPPASSPIQLLPRPDGLPAGIYLLLTSRPPEDRDDAPGFLASAVAPLYPEGAPHLGRLSVALQDAPYQALLTDYLAARLQLDPGKPDNAESVAGIIAAAEQRFVYVSFIADRIETLGREAVERELVASAATGRIGAELYRQWLVGLNRQYGRKEAERIREVLYVLGAAEQAHGWVFGEGRREDPATGAALTMLDETFEGLPLIALAAILDLDRPDHAGAARISADLLLTLERIQGVLRATRAETGTTRFRLGLKELLPVLSASEPDRAGLLAGHARLASTVTDAIDTIRSNDGRDWHAWERVESLVPLLEAAVVLSGSEEFSRRYDPEDVMTVLAALDEVWRDRGYALPRVGWLTQQIALAWQPLGAAHNLGLKAAIDVAGMLQNRGLAQHDAGALLASRADHDAAIKILNGLGNHFLVDGGEVMPVRSDLANAFRNRGLTTSTSGNLADYDAAIAIMEEIRDLLQPDGLWSAKLRNDLAGALQSRGVAKSAGGALAGAVSDFDAAIVIMEGLRELLQPEDGWSVPMRNDLARALQNRGNAKMRGGALVAAVADYDAGVAIRQGLRDLLEQEGGWSVPLRDDLAATLQNRGNAKSLGGALAAALADFDAAITIRAGLCDLLQAQGNWSVSLRSNFAITLQNRGHAKSSGGLLAAAAADFDAAIAIQEGLRDLLQPRAEWTVLQRSAFALALQNRGMDKMRGGPPAAAAAAADFDVAITTMEGLHDLLEPEGGWSVSLDSELAKVLAARHIVRETLGHLSAARADLVRAIDLQREAIKATGNHAPDIWRAALRQWQDWLDAIP